MEFGRGKWLRTDNRFIGTADSLLPGFHAAPRLLKVSEDHQVWPDAPRTMFVYSLWNSIYNARTSPEDQTILRNHFLRDAGASGQNLYNARKSTEACSIGLDAVTRCFLPVLQGIAKPPGVSTEGLLPPHRDNFPLKRLDPSPYICIL